MIPWEVRILWSPENYILYDIIVTMENYRSVYFCQVLDYNFQSRMQNYFFIFFRGLLIILHIQDFADIWHSPENCDNGSLVTLDCFTLYKQCSILWC